MIPNHNIIAKAWKKLKKKLCYLEEFVQTERNYLEQETDVKVISSRTCSVIDDLLLKSFLQIKKKCYKEITRV